MKALRTLCFAAAVAGLLSVARAAPNERVPHIGFLYGAGGQRGTTVKVTVGGQNLRGVKGVRVTGEGVHGTVVEFTPGRRLQGEQLREIRKLLQRAGKRLAAAASGKRRPGREKRREKDKPDAEAEKPVEIPKHPLLDDLEGLTARELKKVAEYFFDPALRQQMSPQIAERVVIEIVIDPGAAPGDRELRLVTPSGLTNPMRFSVGLLPEVMEEEVNDFAPMVLPALKPALVLNGQVDRRDVDRFRFAAKKGQNLVFSTQARSLVPYLADAVPGWFQATLTLTDEEGEEVAFVDDYRFHPDPVLFLPVPKDGEYVLTVRDAIHRGRADFVYRITIGEQPYITSVFPLGGRSGAETEAAVSGWNLPWERVRLETAGGDGAVRSATWQGNGWRSNGVTYAVGNLPECVEAEPNSTAGTAQAIVLPCIVNGRIGESGDVDVFAFSGMAGDEIVAEVHGRILDSPLDSLVKLTDASGRTLFWNDDREGKRIGLITHDADSYLRLRLPADGTYRVTIEDAQRRGGPAFAYRLRIGAARPDFTLMATPSALNMPAGSSAVVTVHALRRDGFDGPIDLTLGDVPAGFVLGGGRIPAGSDKVRMTLTAPAKAPARVIPLELQGTANIGGREIRHPVVPAEDVMQAFLWRHLVPAEEMLVAVTKSRVRVPPIRMLGSGPARIPSGGTAMIRFAARGLPPLDNIHFVLGEGHDGLTVSDVGSSKGGMLLVIGADAGKCEVGSGGNMIVEVYADVSAGRRGAKGQKASKRPTRRVYIGVLPAIPFVVVE